MARGSANELKLERRDRPGEILSTREMARACGVTYTDIHNATRTAKRVGREWLPLGAFEIRIFDPRRGDADEVDTISAEPPPPMGWQPRNRAAGPPVDDGLAEILGEPRARSHGDG